MSAAIELCLRIECKFINACTGENCNSKIFVKTYDDGSTLLGVFCSQTNRCIYQTKLIYNDKIMDKNKTLQEQFDITESILTFNVIQLHNEFIYIKELEWVGYDIEIDIWDPIIHIEKAILPKAKIIDVICNELTFYDVQAIEIKRYEGLIIYYKEDDDIRSHT